MEKVKLMYFVFKQQLTFYSKRGKMAVFPSFLSKLWNLYIKWSHTSQRNSEEQKRTNLVKYFKNPKIINVRCIIIFSIIHYLHLLPTPHTTEIFCFFFFVSFCSSAACFSHCQLSSIAQSVLMISHPGRVQRGSETWLINFTPTLLLLCARDGARHWKSKDKFNIRSLLSGLFKNQNIIGYSNKFVNLLLVL